MQFIIITGGEIKSQQNDRRRNELEEMIVDKMIKLNDFRLNELDSWAET